MKHGSRLIVKIAAAEAREREGEREKPPTCCCINRCFFPEKNKMCLKKQNKKTQNLIIVPRFNFQAHRLLLKKVRGQIPGEYLLLSLIPSH